MAARSREGSVPPSQLADLKNALAEVDQALEDLKKSIEALPESSQETSHVRELPLEEARRSAADLRQALQKGDAAAAAKAARELAQQLSRLSQGLRESGKRVAQNHAEKARASAARVNRAWKEAVDAQEKSVEAARGLVNALQAARLRAQKDLLRRTQDDIDSALASSPSPEAERDLREAARQLAAGKIDQTIKHLRSAKRDAAADSLERGPAESPPDSAASAQAAEAQARARVRTESLRREVTEAAGILGFLPGGPVRRIDAALTEQTSGEQALRQGDSASGLQRGEAALIILQAGGQGSVSDESKAGKIGEGMGQSFNTSLSGGAVRAPAGGMRGSAIGRVRLPSADDYRPPPELREELERSLREPRPAGAESSIKEYFRRLAR